MAGLKTLICSILMAGVVSGCVSTHTAVIAPDTLKIHGIVAPACSDERALELVLDTAAIETLQRGFDKFELRDSRGTVIRKTTRMYNYSVYLRSHTSELTGHELTVKMFREGDEISADAVDARVHLGDNWSLHVALGPDKTCL